MRRFREIIEDTIAPNTSDLWIDNGVIKYYSSKGWKPLQLNIGEDNIPSIAKILTIEITEVQFNKLLIGEQLIIDIKEADSSYDILLLKAEKHKYFLPRVIQTNGTAKYIQDTISIMNSKAVLNTIEAIVSKGVVTMYSLHVGLVPEIVELEIGNSEEIKKANLIILNNLSQNHFFTAINYGYGVGTWQSANGGFAHVTTAYGNEVSYNIGIDGSVTKEDNYIKPNEPYTIKISSDKIGKPVDEITATKIIKCGEIVIESSTGPITYTRSVDSTSTVIYFISSKKDDTLQVLTYTVSNKTITSSIVKHTIPLATKTTAGLVKAGTNIALLAEDADLSTVRGTVNSLLTQLKNAGILIS